MEIKIIENTQVQDCDVLVVSMYENEKTVSEIANTYAIEQDNFKGKFGDTYLLPTYGKEPHKKILIFGLGKKEEFNQDKIRELSAKAIKKAMSIEAKTVAFKLDGIEFDYSEQVATGVLIADYKFDKYKSEKKEGVNVVYLEACETSVRKAEKIVAAMNFARNLANEPAQFATPSELAATACDLGLETKIYDKEECEKMGMGAFLAVGRGSSQEPKFIHMKHTCEKPKKKIIPNTYKASLILYFLLLL